jgi:outer membrane protein
VIDESIFTAMSLTQCMRGRGCFFFILTAVLIGVPWRAAAQTTLTLEDAMTRARAETPDARAAESAVNEAEARIRQARAGYLPRVDVSETVQRGNQPVFAFSSLLSQRRFTADNFAINALNHPDPITNTRTAVTIEQSVFDAGQTRLATRAASLGRDVAAAERERAGHDLGLRAAQAFVRVLQLEAMARANDAAVTTADSDLQRAKARRDSGLVTDADVLAVEVHIADVRQRQIATRGDLAVARIQLAEAVGLPFAEPITLQVPALPATSPSDDLVATALKTRSEVRQAQLRQELADNARRAAQARYLPTFGVQGGYEFNGSNLSNQQSSWIVGAQLQLNVFRGFADQARLSEARHALTRATADRERLERSIEVDVRAAMARLTAARARLDAGRAAVTQARESQRIIRDRYEGGLATVTDVLRAAQATLDAEFQSTAADMDVILQTVALDRAVGRR